MNRRDFDCRRPMSRNQLENPTIVKELRIEIAPRGKEPHLSVNTDYGGQSSATAKLPFDVIESAMIAKALGLSDNPKINGGTYT